MDGHVVIVGGSLAGLRTAESILASGFQGDVTIFGDEDVPPYSRPPLSKQALMVQGTYAPEVFRRKDNWERIRWRLGHKVTASALKDGVIEVATGEQVHFDGLVVASGLRPRRLAVEGPVGGRHVLRTIDDAEALRSAVSPTARVVVVGGGFLGCEVAASAISRGAAVTLVMPQVTPLEHLVGVELGQVIGRRHQEHGVRIVAEQTVTGLVGRDRVEGVVLTSGEVLDATVLVEAVGAIPNVEWLDGNALDLSDGVLCDNQMQVLGHDRVVAVGDIARFPNPLYSNRAGRFEHWNMVTETAKCAARSLMVQMGVVDDPAGPFVPIPSFWSDQFDMRIQAFGDPKLGMSDRRELYRDEQGDEFAMGYYLDDALVGVAGIGAVKRLLTHRSQLVQRAEAIKDRVPA